ncbi:lysozyme [Erwinia tracheiphila]|uniref:Lysozyme n=1 Tax=Erwinia tracheiphila TaxID=65700 RepID=A0A0M2KFF2_9GAMM|nr:lysozyme [Erwinia tracheiphila]EOS93097.1 glycoside hydrolase family protein [Erwinia tracheiphila PSU-1]KKF37664.1 muraminidase [Erwinia tracheiphila]UIA89061.1 lysozyme [Erwinia tracheiphila]UIA97444.1 lysozyme [Erwinia tracheiphila]
MSLRTSENGIALIKRSEALRLDAYQDAVGVWTIGYGWTEPVEGIPVHGGMSISQDTAEILLRNGLLQYERTINQLVTATLNQNQFDALVSLAYNIGLGAFERSTLLKKLNAGDMDGAAAEFLRWNKAGGKVLPGLDTRRKAEATLFQTIPG